VKFWEETDLNGDNDSVNRFLWRSLMGKRRTVTRKE
jgi:hypothetical protein